MWKWLTGQATSTSDFEPPRIRTDYPYGTCVSTEDGHWLIRDKMRFRIPNVRVLRSWDFHVIPAHESAVKHYKKAGVLGFRDATLIKNVADGKMYIIAQNKKRHITNPEVFTDLGLTYDVIDVSDADAKLHDDGEVLI